MSEVDADATVRRAAALGDAGRHTEAIQLLRPLVARMPNHASALCQLAASCLNAGDAGDAEQFARRATVVDPTHHWPHLLCSLALCDLARYREAVEAARKAVHRQPHQWRCHVALAEALIWGGDRALYGQAATSAFRAVELAPDEPRTHEVLGDALLRRGDRSGAAASYRRALEFPLDSAQAADIEANLRIAEEQRGSHGRGSAQAGGKRQGRSRSAGARPEAPAAGSDAETKQATGAGNAGWAKVGALFQRARQRSAGAGRDEGSVRSRPGSAGAAETSTSDSPTDRQGAAGAAGSGKQATDQGGPRSSGVNRLVRPVGVAPLLRRIWLVQGVGVLALMIQAAPDSNRVDGFLGLALVALIVFLAMPIVAARARLTSARGGMPDGRIALVGAPLGAGTVLLAWWAVTVVISPGTLSPLSLAMVCTVLGAGISLLTGLRPRRR